MFKKRVNEEKIIAKCLKGDTNAYEIIIDRYKSLVCAITFSGTGNLESSEELAHEAFISAWQNLDKLNDIARFKSWLISIAKNIVRNWIRSKKRDVLGETLPVDNVEKGDWPTPDQQAIDKENQLLVNRALMGLPYRYREVLVMYYRQGESVKDVAGSLRLSEEAVKSRLHRGRKMIKDQLEGVVETTIRQSRPGKKFAVGVIGSITGLGVGAGSAGAAGGGIVTAVGSAKIATTTTTIGTVVTKVVSAAAIVAIGVGSVMIFKGEKANGQREENNSIQKAQLVTVQADVVDDNDMEIEADLQPDPQPVPVYTTEINSEIKPEQQPIAANDHFKMKIKVLDDVNESPLAGANLRVNKGCGCRCEPDNYVTDTNGIYVVDFGAKKPNYASVYVVKKGYVPVQFTWRADQGEGVDDSFTFYLSKARTIGGVIKNERGETVPDAEVEINMYIDHDRDYPWVYIDELKEFTDANGRWEFDMFPHIEHNYSVKLRHPDYANTRIWIRETEGHYKKLLVRQSELIIPDGIDIVGWVVNENDIPVSGARVFTHEDRFDSDAPSTKTDAEGKFEFKHFLPTRTENKIVLTVQTDGYAPAMQTYPMTKEFEPVIFTLAKPNIIKARVIDPKGNPVPGANVYAEYWRGFRSLKWQSKSDSDGRFQWDNAPADEVEFDVDKSGKMRISRVELIASDKEHEIVMGQQLVVSGTVVDADSNEPITDFSICQGIQWEDKRLHWNCRESDMQDFGNGQYKITFGYPYPGHLIRVEADGYAPAKSRVFTDDEGSVEFDFRLEKAKAQKGFVYDPNGEPVKDAEIHFVTANKWEHFENGKPQNTPSQREMLITDEIGRFDFSDIFTDVSFKVLVMHEKGFAEVNDTDFNNDPNVQLKKWAIIEGYVYSGSGVLPNANVMCNNYDVQRDKSNIKYYYASKVTADANGYFIADRVIPGNVSVSRYLQTDDGRAWYSSSENVIAKSGKTEFLEIGGGGRTVTGKLVKPDFDFITEDFRYTHAMIRSPQSDLSAGYELYKDMEFPRPADFDTMTVKEIMQWYEGWYQSDESEEFRKQIQEKASKMSSKMNQRFNVMTNSNGTFYSYDVPGGEYTIAGLLYQANAQGFRDADSKQVAELKYEFEVEPLTEENENIPVDLGVLEYTETKDKFDIGRDFDNFTATDLYTDQTFELADYKGKYVLITIYHVSGQSSEDKYFGQIVNIQNDYLGYDDFEMVGLTIGGFGLMEMLVEKFNDEKGFLWRQGLLGSDGYVFLQKYKIQKWPSSILIGPDGKVIDMTSDPDELYGIVANTLANPQ